MSRYSFSGHESFQCKSLWLKKGYDFLLAGNSFSEADAVGKLGVGKNMITSIRFWLRVFGLTKADELTPVASYIFDSENGADPFSEDINTLWILHFLLVANGIASIYSLLFEDFQREKREFTKPELQGFIKRKCSVPEQKNVYNENTVRKDIGVLLKNYIAPSDLKTIEDFSALLISLGLLVKRGKHDKEDVFAFNEISSDMLYPEVILFALAWLREGQHTDTISFDQLQRLSLIFCMSMTTLIEIIRSLQKKYPQTLVYSDNSGIKNVQFLSKMGVTEALDNYYHAL